MIHLIIYLIGCFIVYKYSNDIMKLGYKTMNEPYKDDYKSFFDTDDADDFPDIFYMFSAIFFSWLFVFLIYLLTITHISQNRKNQNNNNESNLC